ncbi:MAG: hypothetical protein NC433_09665 [Clostridiales bacterium]|nr:hypothetical protein [Clostridiales bacterium]
MAYIFQNQQFIINCLLSILGIIFTIYFSIKRKYRQLAYTYNTIHITSTNADNNFIKKLSYNEHPINNIYYTDLIIWCKGKIVINDSDVAPKSPLNINIPDNMNILDYHIIAQNELANNIKLQTNDNCIKVTFDYLSYKNGVAIRIIHSGNSKNMSVTCKLKDGRRTLFICKRKGFLYKFLNNKFVKYILSSKITSFIFIIFTVFLFPNAFVQSGNYSGNNFFDLPSTNIFMNLDSLIILILCCISFILAIPHVYNIFKTEVPNNLLNNTSCEK